MIAPARHAAFRILQRVETSDAHSDELLRSPEVDALSAQDRNLTTMLVLGTLRWQLALDARIRLLLSRPEMKLAAETAVTLRMGAYQLLHLERVPAHAVINDAVELLKQGRERGAAGMVNAVLRRIAALPQWKPPGTLGSAQEIAAAWSHPEWMVERWAQRYGIEAAAAICRWDQEPAGVTFRMQSNGDSAVPGLELESAAFLSEARRLLRGDPGPALHSGKVRIQDEASQLVAEIAAGASPEAKRVLDTCAAPGGKAAILIERLPSAQITVMDVSRRRLGEMQRRFSTPAVKLPRFEAADAAKLQLKPEYSLILCDVPCSGTGTMARNPEIRLRVELEDLERQQARQVAIVRAALAGLLPGGRLVYSTCSLEPEENEAVIEKFRRDGFRLIPVAEILDRLGASGALTLPGRELLRGATDGEFLRTIPGIHPCDGFFAAIIEKSG